MKFRFGARAHALVLLTTLALAIAAPARAQAPGADLSTPRPPFGISVRITGANSPAPCAEDSVRVVISGVFPNDCYGVRGIEYLLPRCGGPCPPVVLLQLDDGGCLRRVCEDVPTPFRAVASFGGLPAGDYTLSLGVRLHTCPDTLSDPPLPGVVMPFTVRPDSLCAVNGEPCLISDWRDDDPTSACDARLDAEGRARVSMRLFTPVALKALGGSLHLSDDSLVVESVRPIGPASGMTLIWEPDQDGASFVMFAASGAPIPATAPGTLSPAILEVGVRVRFGRHAPRAAWLGDRQLLGADAEGNGVKPCPIMALVVRDARICAEPAVCDANGDGRLNVRDLVTMLRCLQASCPDSVRFDCDADRHFDLDDVICCARRLLHERPVPHEAPRPGAAARLEFGELQRTATGWRVPLRVTGFADLGAARLALRFPADRYELAGLAQRPGAANWLSLHETDGGEIALALLNLDPGSLTLVAPGPIELTLDLALREGRSPGGTVEVVSGEFSSADGAALDVPLPQGLSIPAGVSLSAGRPNPFSGSTRLVLGLEHAIHARVTVHDLSGRRVATLIEGALEAGQRELTWNGRDDSGARVPGGIYFVRAAGAGEVVSQKVVLLGAR